TPDHRTEKREGAVERKRRSPHRRLEFGVARARVVIAAVDASLPQLNGAVATSTGDRAVTSRYHCRHLRAMRHLRVLQRASVSCVIPPFRDLCVTDRAPG